MFTSSIAIFIYGVVTGAIAYALVIKKNPKVQADVAKAATQAQATGTAVVADAKADVKKV